jgi:hypothetical protein
MASILVTVASLKTAMRPGIRPSFSYSNVRKPIQQIRSVFLVSAYPVTQMYWLPATWVPIRYQGWTSTSEQTMTFQDTRAGVSPLLPSEVHCL